MGIRKFIISALLLNVILATNLFAKEGDLWQTSGNVTIRKEPNANSEVVSYLKQGIVVEEIAQQDRWIKAKSTKSGVTGWIHKSMLIPVTKDLKTGCEGVQGFTAVCPVQKNEQSIQGMTANQTNPINQPKVNFSNIPANQQTQKDQEVKQPKIPVLPQNVPLPVVQQNIPFNTKNPDVSSPTTLKPGGVNLLSNIEEINNDMKEEKFSLIGGNSYIVSPEKLSMIKMSSSDINRIVCPVDIKDVVYSEEKGIQVKISGQNAFVKFLVKRINNKEVYSNIPVDMYIVCGDKVYNIVALPERIPPVNIYLEDKEQKIKEVLDKNQSLPYEKKLVNYIKDFISGKVPPESIYTRKEIEYKLYQDIEIREKGQYVIEGEGFTIRIFHVTGKKQNIEIKEKDFLRKEITQNPLAISLDKLKLNQNDKAVLIIVERTRG